MASNVQKTYRHFKTCTDELGSSVTLINTTPIYLPFYILNSISTTTVWRHGGTLVFAARCALSAVCNLRYSDIFTILKTRSLKIKGIKTETLLK